MAIGNPISLTSNVATKTISVIATASQSIFTVNGGYRINELAVFRNGVRLVDGRDFTARDGSIVTLLSAASEGDALEFQVFDTFRVADAITPFDSAQTIAGDLSIVGVLSATTLGSVNFNLTSGIQTFHDVRVGGALTVAGSLTYEDTTNTNTTGIATFSGGMNISGVGATVTTLNVTGVSTFASNVSIADSIFHTGDTDTSIRFPATETITAETGGSERLRIHADGEVECKGGGAGQNALLVTGNYSSGSNVDIQTWQRTGGAVRTKLGYKDADTSMFFGTDTAHSLAIITSGTERLRIDSSGNITAVNTASGGQSVTLKIGASASSGANAGNIIINNGGTGDGALQFDYEGSAARAKIYVYRSTEDLIFDTAGSEALRIDSSGRLLVGTTSARTNYFNSTSYGPLLNLEGTSNANRVLSFIHNDSSGAPLLVLGATGGSAAGSNTIIGSSGKFGFLSFQGADGSQLVEGAKITGEVDGTPGADDMPGRLIFSTTADGAASPTERLRITSDGKLRVPDGGMFTAGAGDDLQINHDSSNTFIDNYTGTLVLRNYADNSDILLSSDDSSGGTADYVRCDGSEGSVILSHYGSTKLETSSAGVTVTGTLNATTDVTIDGKSAATTGKAIAMAFIFG